MSYSSLKIKDLLTRLPNWVLPSFQRHYVWSEKQVAKLFDSLLRGYPINTLLLWEADLYASSAIQFYDFLHQKYVSGTKATPTKHTGTYGYTAVIDGQQRLTSLRIGLQGSYNGKFLYLHTINASEFEFRFEMSSNIVKNPDGAIPCHWFKVSDMMDPAKFSTIGDVTTKAAIEGWDKESLKWISNLWNVVNNTEIYYDIERGDIDKVLEVFKRINKGTPLKPAQLAMSELSKNWKDARTKFKDLEDEWIKKGYAELDDDVIIRTCLMIFQDDVRYGSLYEGDTKKALTTIGNIQTHWNDIRPSFDALLYLLQNEWKLTPKTLTSIFSLTVLVYFIYKHSLSRTIVTGKLPSTVSRDMKRWLVLVLLKGTFGNATDTSLKTMRDLVKSNSSGTCFPYSAIKSGYKEKGVCVLDVTSADIDAWVKVKYEDPKCYLLLALVCPPIESPSDEEFDKDHLHAKTNCKSNPICKNWNLLPNLTRQDHLENTVEKNSRQLDEWYNNSWIGSQSQLGGRNGTAADLLLEDGSGLLPLKIADFADYYARREQILRDKIAAIF